MILAGGPFASRPALLPKPNSCHAGYVFPCWVANANPYRQKDCNSLFDLLKVDRKYEVPS